MMLSGKLGNSDRGIKNVVRLLKSSNTLCLVKAFFKYEAPTEPPVPIYIPIILVASK